MTGPATRARGAATRRPPLAAAVRWTVWAVLAAVLAGCGGAGRPARPGPSPHVRAFVRGGTGGFLIVSSGGGARPSITAPVIPPAHSTLVIQLPLESYEEARSEQQDVLAAAANSLLQRCMALRGFVYSGAAQSADGLVSLQAIEREPIGLTSLAQAQAFGYIQPNGSRSGAAFAPFATVYGPAFFKMVNSAGKDWASAMFGFVPGQPGRAGQPGCLLQTQRQLYGSAGPSGDPVIQMAALALNWTRTDPRIVAAQRIWSACMRRHGYSYGSPAQAEQRRWPNPPDKAETAVAVADVTCKTAADLPNTWLAVEAAYQLALIGQDLTALAGSQAEFAARLRRLQALLGAQA